MPATVGDQGELGQGDRARSRPGWLAAVARAPSPQPAIEQEYSPKATPAGTTTGPSGWTSRPEPARAIERWLRLSNSAARRIEAKDTLVAGQVPDAGRLEDDGDGLAHRDVGRGAQEDPRPLAGRREGDQRERRPGWAEPPAGRPVSRGPGSRPRVPRPDGRWRRSWRRRSESRRSRLPGPGRSSPGARARPGQGRRSRRGCGPGCSARRKRCVRAPRRHPIVGRRFHPVLERHDLASRTVDLTGIRHQGRAGGGCPGPSRHRPTGSRERQPIVPPPNRPMVLPKAPQRHHWRSAAGRLPIRGPAEARRSQRPSIPGARTTRASTARAPLDEAITGFRSTSSRSGRRQPRSARATIRSTTAVRSMAGRPRTPSRIRLPAQPLEHRPGSRPREWCELDRHVVEDLGEDAAQADDHERAELGVAPEADDQLDPGRQARLDEQAAQSDVGCPANGQERVGRRRHGSAIGQAERSPRRSRSCGRGRVASSLRATG